MQNHQLVAQKMRWSNVLFKSMETKIMTFHVGTKTGLKHSTALVKTLNVGSTMTAKLAKFLNMLKSKDNMLKNTLNI